MPPGGGTSDRRAAGRDRRRGQQRHHQQDLRSDGKTHQNGCSECLAGCLLPAREGLHLHSGGDHRLRRAGAWRSHPHRHPVTRWERPAACHVRSCGPGDRGTGPVPLERSSTVNPLLAPPQARPGQFRNGPAFNWPRTGRMSWRGPGGRGTPSPRALPPVSRARFARCARSRSTPRRRPRAGPLTRAGARRALQSPTSTHFNAVLPAVF